MVPGSHMELWYFIATQHWNHSIIDRHRAVWDLDKALPGVTPDANSITHPGECLGFKRLIRGQQYKSQQIQKGIPAQTALPCLPKQSTGT